MRCASLALLLVACSDPVGPDARLVVSERRLDFGQVPVGRNHTRPMEISNAGAFPLQVTAVTVSEPAFEVFPSTLKINPGEAAELRVRFMPDRAGNFAAAMSFESNASRGATLAVALSGVGACSGIGCPALDAGQPEADDARVRDAETEDGEADGGGAEDAALPDDAAPIDTGVDAGVAGLAASYRFEETSGALVDDSGNMNDGVPASAGLTRGVQGKIGNAVEFEGSVGQFLIPADPTLDGTGALSIELWINTSNTGANQTILARGLNIGNDGLFLTTQCDNIHVEFSRTGVTGTANATTQCNAFAEHQWVHVGVVNDGLFLTVYLDGRKVVENMGGFLGPIGAPLYLGRKEPGVEPFTGRIDELTWWTVPRTQAEVCGAAGGTFDGTDCVP